MAVHVFGPKDKVKPPRYINTTSHSTVYWQTGLSPFHLGPVKLYGEYIASNVENGWQYSKVYSQFLIGGKLDKDYYYDWAKGGWNKQQVVRYPMGKGAKPEFCLWEGKRLTYLQARKKVYCPLYSKAVERTEAYRTLKAIYEFVPELWLWDFDGYDHKALGMDYSKVLNSPTRKMGHAFVLAMMLENQRIWED